MRGPEALVALVQEDVRTSAGFDWQYLASMWPLMVATRTDWLQTARPRAAHDRAARTAMIAAGGSAALGAGYGEEYRPQHNETAPGRIRQQRDAVERVERK